ncbi:DUF6602 domain-containing protein [Demequina sp. NBRC 110053]|uniref:DUF6602 domain-containing protein n=1 Tax=Demequina sp. NBRC 110053 TaxID=1570342 RepID=UPI001184AC8B|nr:DUF6602 domain-containing protein [Demequina sp. NBRC 110053]
MSAPGLIERYWTGVATQLQLEVNSFSRLIEHQGEKGRANELAMAQMVGRLLPSSLAVGSGVIFDQYGKQSRQIDLIVFDMASRPQLLAQSSQILFPVETVLAAVEVKTTLDAQEARDIGEKVESVRTLESSSALPPAIGAFAYSAAVSPATAAEHLASLEDSRRPEFACVLDPGVVGGVAAGDALAGLVPLHELDAEGERVPYAWQLPEAPALTRFSRSGVDYPVSRLDKASAAFTVFEPGRALLLFADALLSELASRSDTRVEWLSGYIPSRAREVVAVAPRTADSDRD